MAKNVRVLIVEDHDMARMGLSVVLGNNERIEVVGMSADGQDGVDKALELIPDVVIMDIGLPTIDGIEATKRIKSQNTKIKVLMYTSREDEDDILILLRLEQMVILRKGQRQNKQFLQYWQYQKEQAGLIQR